MTNERPVVKAMIARLLRNGQIGKPRVVTLAAAYMAQRSGVYAVVGPDPEDMAKVAEWDREHEQFRNQPRMP